MPRAHLKTADGRRDFEKEHAEQQESRSAAFSSGLSVCLLGRLGRAAAPALVIHCLWDHGRSGCCFVSQFKSVKWGG